MPDIDDDSKRQIMTERELRPNESRREKIRKDTIRSKVDVKAAIEIIQRQQIEWLKQTMIHIVNGNKGRG
uniref:Uncharacterized protein n=1 Tax=Arion vulgaris TaxID=1028688 RepID=A0A0B7AX18_9EUPU